MIWRLVFWFWRVRVCNIAALNGVDGDAVAQTDDAASAAAHEVVAGGIEGVEVVFFRGERDAAAHGKVGNVDKEAEVAHGGAE